jgi:hypothetical protein
MLTPYPCKDLTSNLKFRLIADDPAGGGILQDVIPLLLESYLLDATCSSEDNSLKLPR